MPSERTKKAITYATVGLIAAVAGILTYDAFTDDGEEERPPIIVQGGSVEITIEYPDETHGSKGSWQPVGGSGKYRHEHTLSGPSRMRNSVFNGTCTGGAWRNGSLRITYTDGTTDWTLELQVQGNHIELDPKGQSVKTYSADPSHLTANPTSGADTWIKSVEPLVGGGGSSCTFDQNSKPVIRIEQKR